MKEIILYFSMKYINEISTIPEDYEIHCKFCFMLLVQSSAVVPYIISTVSSHSTVVENWLLYGTLAKK